MMHQALGAINPSGGFSPVLAYSTTKPAKNQFYHSKKLTSHSSSRNKIKVLFSFRFEERHGFLGQIVRSHSKRDYFQLVQPWSHFQNSGSVDGVVQVSIWGSVFALWVWHSGRVSSYYIEVGTGYHSRFGMPLNLMVFIFNLKKFIFYA